MTDVEPSRFGATRALAWGAYLGCSWTWCIGMYLPGILWRDYGIWGWIVFAIPNVLGAAAMGFVLARREQSLEMVARHRQACLIFSLVTLAFHGFWMVWFLQHVVGPVGVGFALLIAVATWGIGRSRTWRAAAVGVGVWIFSVGLLISGLVRDLTMWPGRGIAAGESFIEQGLIWMIPLICFSFLLCPYLDLTFHEAAQHTDKARRRLAFGVGFGVMFLTMIVFSLLYAKLQFATFSAGVGKIFLQFKEVASTHLIIQFGFTVGVHCLAVSTRGQNKPSHLRGGAISIAALLFGGAIAWAVNYHAESPLLGGERVYMMFLAMYAIAFPTYVWIAMVPHRWRDRATPMGQRTSLMIVLVAAGPMLWFAFFEPGFRFLAIPAVLLALVSPVLSVPPAHMAKRS